MSPTRHVAAKNGRKLYFIYNKDKEKMPMRIRKGFSGCYLSWGKALLEENYKGLWKDALALSISYNPFNIGAWYHYIIGFFPSFVRPGLIELYKALGILRRKLQSTASKLKVRLRTSLDERVTSETSKDD